MTAETPVEMTNQAEPPVMSATPTPEQLLLELEQTRAALKKANAEAAGRRKDLEKLEQEKKDKADAELSEMDKLTKRLQEAEARAKSLELSQRRSNIAAKVGLPMALAGRLQGETDEELEADANTILALIPKQTAPKLNPTNPGGEAKAPTEDALRKSLYGSQTNMFDPAFQKQSGGGVLIVERD